MISKTLWVAAVLLLVLCTACSSTSAAAQNGSAGMPVASATLASNSSAATGTPAVCAMPSGGFPAGSFKADHPAYTKKLLLGADCTYQQAGIIEGDKVLGTYTVSGDHITFTETDGGCMGQPGEYISSFDGSALVFKMVKDECSFRRVDLTSSTWTKQP